jgi:hypothetical protein
MSRPRIYESAAKRQAAYRLRSVKRAGEINGADTDLTAAAARSQWLRSLRTALDALSAAQTLMERYCDMRSESWQGGDRGERHSERLQSVSEAIDATRDALEP